MRFVVVTAVSCRVRTRRGRHADVCARGCQYSNLQTASTKRQVVTQPPACRTTSSVYRCAPRADRQQHHPISRSAGGEPAAAGVRDPQENLTRHVAHRVARPSARVALKSSPIIRSSRRHHYAAISRDRRTPTSATEPRVNWGKRQRGKLAAAPYAIFVTASGSRDTPSTGTRGVPSRPLARVPH